MKNKNDSDWTFTFRMHKIAAHSRISRGLAQSHVLLVLHSDAGHVYSSTGTDGTYMYMYSWEDCRQSSLDVLYQKIEQAPRII